MKNVRVGGFELFRIFLSYNVSCWRWKMWRWEWYRGERWTSEEACSPSWRRERWTLNARWPKFLISKNIFTFCFFSGGGGLQQRHQCWREYNLDENSKVIFLFYSQKSLFRRQVSRKIFCFLLHWETPVSPSPSSGGLPSRRQSGSPSGLPPSPWPPSCSSSSPRFDSFSSLYFFNGRPFLAGGDKDPPGPSFKGDGTPPNCMVYIWSSCKAGWILHLPF